MKHPNTALLEKLYSHFNQGDLAGFLAGCSDQMTFQVPGKSRLSGKYTQANFHEFAAKIKDLSAGSFQMEVHDILASDLHAAVLATDRVTREGKTTEFRTVHIWRFENQKPVAWYEYPRDLYQFDALWRV